ncbi:hypothetical protein AGMMS4956_00270 [Bacteroidia bacterium]|nr:hypothetical protein AGMMS4956_00270 [Bacteroidia bacterium]
MKKVYLKAALVAAMAAGIAINSCKPDQPTTPEDKVQANTVPGTATVSGNAANTCPAATVTLTASATNAASYRWYNGNSITPIAGATSNTYTVTAYGTYYAAGLNATGEGTKSTGKTVAISYCPIVPQQAVVTGDATNTCPTATVTLTANASGATSYKWYKGNDLINGATSSTYAATESATYYAAGVNDDGEGTKSTGKVLTIESCFNYFTETGGGLNFDMVAVAGGTFTMGCTAEQGSDCYSDEIAHSVTLSSFSIGKYEVTQKLWYDVMGSYPETAPSSTYGVGNNYPMYYVSWEDIVGTSSSSVGYTEKGITYYTNGFCYKLSVKVNGGTLGTKHYRLPTEAEWEYAARGGASSGGYTYSGSNTIGNVAWYYDNSGSKSHAVGTTPSANELGIYDMSGNVWEWCSDWSGSYSSSAQTNPTGASSGSYRVFRGGSWSTYARGCRVAYCISDAPSYRYDALGFRLVLP